LISLKFARSRGRYDVTAWQRRSAPGTREGEHVKSIRIIQDEHRSLSAVLHALLYLVRQVADHGMEPDFRVLGAMVHYIDTVPERFHHPKEDKYLFALLRERHPDAAPLLDRLQRDHQIGAEKIHALEQTLLRYEHQGGEGGRSSFASAVEAFAVFHREHMRIEEQEILPLAAKHLTPTDWARIDAAFTGHTDPLFGLEASATHAKLLRRIVNLAPPPIGIGPKR
jgi:hemerythrin-like domain-containing protein